MPILTKHPTTVFLKMGRWTNLSSLNLDSRIFSRSSRVSIVLAFLTTFLDLCLSVSDSPEEILDTDDELELDDEVFLLSSSPPELELEYISEAFIFFFDFLDSESLSDPPCFFLCFFSFSILSFSFLSFSSLAAFKLFK